MDPENATSPTGRSSFMRFLDEAKGTLGEKLDRLRAPSPSEALRVPSSPDDTTTTTGRARGGSVVVLQDPAHHERHGSDEGEKEDVIRLLKQCLAAAGNTEEELRVQIKQLEKEVDFWKKESYSGISVTLESISNSPQYKDLKEKHRVEQNRVEELTAQLDAEKKRLAQLQQDFAAQALVASESAQEAIHLLEVEKSQSVVAVGKLKQMVDIEIAARLKAEAKVTEQMAWMKQLQDRFDQSVALSEALTTERDQARQALAEALQRAESAEAQLLSRERHVGTEELQCLQRDRQALAVQLQEAKEELKRLRRGGVPLPVALVPNDQHQPLKEEDMQLQKRFGLDHSQMILSVHGAALGPQHGHLWLTRNFLCFGGSALQSFYDQQDWTIPVDTLVALDSVGMGKLVLHRQEEKAVTLSGIRERDELVRQVLGVIGALHLPEPKLMREGQVVLADASQTTELSEHIAKEEGQEAEDFVLV